MIEIVKEYRGIVNLLPSIIKKSDFKSSYFQKLIGCSEATYYRKLRESDFNISEVEAIIEAVFPKETYYAQINADIDEAEEDFKNGRYSSHEDVMKRLREKYS